MGNENSTKSYVPFTPIVGEKVGEDSYLFSSKDVKSLNDTLYALTKMVQGGLNLANLNKETNQVFTDIEGNVTTVTETAAGLTVSVSALSGDVSTISATVDGLSVADETGSYTIINGDKLISKDHDTSTITEIEDGGIKFKIGAALQGEIYGTGVGILISPSQYLTLGGQVRVGLGNEKIQINGYPVKITSASNASLDSLGTIYIGASSGYSGNVDIGQTGGTINLNGTVLHNGVPI